MHGSTRKGAAAFAVLIIASLAIVASAFARADAGPAASSRRQRRLRQPEDRVPGADHR